jgi:multidrug efflux pump subunit AcrB
MLTLNNVASPFFEAIGVVVILCLIFSLVESKWILPSHLAHMKYKPYSAEKANWLERVQHNIREKMEHFAQNNYRNFLNKVARYRYLTSISFLTLLFVSVAVLHTGYLKFEIFPSVANDGVQASFTINEGSSSKYRDEVLKRMETSIQTVDERLSKQANGGDKSVKSMISWTQGDYSGSMYLELTRGELRQVNATEIEKAWREEVGELPAIKSMRFISSTGVGGDAALSYNLVGDDNHQLKLAAQALKNKLKEFKGVYDIRSSYSNASQEIKLNLKPQADILGITLEDLGRQVRQAFQGEEAQRIQRGKDEIKVMVRFPRSDRESIDRLETMRIKTAQGGWVPFEQIASYELGLGYANIQRKDRKRAINIQADFDAQITKSGEVTDAIKEDFQKQLEDKFPGVKMELSGQSKESDEFMRELALAFGAAFALIYMLIAIPLKSYTQPIIVMIVIPFGFIGAVVGHLIFGKDISMMSMFGLVALMGVVVNDSLLMVDFVNRARREG